MTDFNLSVAQKQYDNQEPPRYNRKSALECSYCKEEICVGNEYFNVLDRVYCSDCVEVKTLYAEDFESVPEKEMFL